jgi:putative addiction module CopG family antidote
MHLPLTPELEAIIDEAVQSGRYATPLDAAREAFALLEEHEAKFRALKHEIERGMASPIAGVLDDDLITEIKREGRARLAERRKPR